jgi:hypothetical protein
MISSFGKNTLFLFTTLASYYSNAPAVHYALITPRASCLPLPHSGLRPIPVSTLFDDW